ncbi:MAG: hypothetical protein E7Z80_07595 [Methanobrevibacter thaueri]|nr:hypothetical protein [Methanobrevibacter thaueri]
MYLNICEYIKFEEQDELLEMIDMETRTRGIRESIFNEGKNQGFNDGRKSVVRDLAENYSIEEVAGILKISVNEVWDIIND